MPSLILPAAGSGAGRAQAPEIDRPARRELLAHAAEQRQRRSPALAIATSSAPGRNAAVAWDSRFQAFRTTAQQAQFAAWLEAWRDKGKGEEGVDETADPMVESKSREFATEPPNPLPGGVGVAPVEAVGVAAVPLRDEGLVWDERFNVFRTAAQVVQFNEWLQRWADKGKDEEDSDDIHPTVLSTSQALSVAPPQAMSSGAGVMLDWASTITATADDAAVEHARRLAMDRTRYEEVEVAAGRVPLEDAGPQGPSAALTRAEGGAWLASGIFGMAAGLRDFAAQDRNGWERAIGLGNFAAGTAAAIGSSAQIAASHLESDSAAEDDAADFANWGLGYQEMFTALSAGLKTIKGVVELVRMYQAEEKDTAAWVSTGGDVLAGGLETAKGVLRSIRQINETLSGSVGAQFGQVLPGLDIALLSVKSIMQGYYLVVSAVNYHHMRRREAELQPSDEHARLTMHDKRHIFADLHSRKAQLQMLIAEKQAKIEKLRRQRTGTGQDATKTRRIDDKLASLGSKKTRYELRLRDVMAQLGEADADGGLTRADLSELDLVHMLRINARKRIVRQSIHISANIVQAGASIATLVSGPGAPGAVAVRAAAAGIDASLPFLRWVKQKGRDSAARAAAKGETNLASKVFNPKKGSSAKAADRAQQATTLMRMVVAVQDERRAFRERTEAAFRVGMYLEATGVDTDALFVLNGQPARQHALLVKALGQRELGE